MLVLMLGRETRCKRRGAVYIPPDSTGLVGTPPADRPLLPLKFWANPRKSPLKPRSKDLEESALLRLMGQDFDPRWMRSGDYSHSHKQVPVRWLEGFEVVGCFNFFLLLPTWYTNFLFIHTNYMKLNSSTRFERNPLIIRRSTTQIVHMQPLVSSLSASDRLVFVVSDGRIVFLQLYFDLLVLEYK